MTMKKRGSCQSCPALHEPCLRSGSGENPAHLIVVGENPSGFSIGKGEAFFGRNGRFFKHLLEFVQAYADGKYEDVQIYYTYAALVGAYDPTADHVNACRVNLFRDILNVRGVTARLPVIVPLGPLATRALGLTIDSINDVVGQVLTLQNERLGPHPYKVVPLLSMQDVQKFPGKVNVEVASLLKATKLAFEGETKKAEPDIESLTKDYVYPRTIEEVERCVDNIIAYYNPDTNIGPDDWALAIDTETNTLHPWSEGAKVLMLSVAWDNGKAATILLDHPDTPYDAQAAWTHVKRLLQCPKPKSFHNAKFDLQFLERAYGIRTTRVVWDTMLGEHYLDEDKKGLYGLKKLATIYTPAYTGYDDKLQQILRGMEEVDAFGRDKEGKLTVVEDEIPNMETPIDVEADDWKSLVDLVAERAAARKLTPTKRKKQGIELKFIQKQISELYQKMKLKRWTKKSKVKVQGGGFSNVPLDEILRYAAIDADVTRMIMKAQMNRVAHSGFRDEARHVMSTLYLPGTRTLADMEFQGFAVDQEYLDQISAEIADRADALSHELKTQFYPDINYSAPEQVADVMRRMNFGAIPGEEPGSTKAEVLESYMKMYPENDKRYVFASKIIDFRAANLSKNNFLRKAKRLSSKDGRIHCSFNLNGTATGRLSSSEPNMQNVPLLMCRTTKKDKDGNETVVHPGWNIKKIFVPSIEGNVVVNIDIKGAELRVYTAYSEDELMIEALLSGQDIHSLVCSRIYKIPYEDVVRLKESDPDIKEKRDRAKRVVFGIFYGAGPWKISQQINSTIEEAEKIQTMLFTEFPALHNYVETVKHLVRTRQYVKTFFGRCRRFKLAHLGGSYFGDACREAVNFLIQSTASDLLLGQMCEIHEHIHELDGKLLITVHDSITLEMPEKNVERLPAFLDHYIVERVQEKFDWLPVPFLYDMEVGPSYGEVHEYKRKDTETEVHGVPSPDGRDAGSGEGDVEGEREDSAGESSVS